MNKKEQIQLFENRNVRTLWDEQEEEWYFSIVDVVAILTDQQDSKKASTYWSVLKGRLRKEGADEPLTKCKKLKMLSADGKTHPTDAATAETLFRIIQTIPYFEQAIEDYKRLGYSERWINQRIQTIRARKELTDEWNRAGVKEGQQYATLTDIITKEWSGKTTRQYKDFKGLKKESLRDNMTTMELALNMVAEAATVEISKAENPKGFRQSANIAHKGGKIAADTRARIEAQTGKSIVSSEKASDYLPPADRWDSLPEETETDNEDNQ